MPVRSAILAMICSSVRTVSVLTSSCGKICPFCATIVARPSRVLTVKERAEPLTARPFLVWRKYTKRVSACSPLPSNFCAWMRRRSALCTP